MIFTNVSELRIISIAFSIRIIYNGSSFSDFLILVIVTEPLNKIHH